MIIITSQDRTLRVDLANSCSGQVSSVYNLPSLFCWLSFIEKLLFSFSFGLFWVMKDKFFIILFLFNVFFSLI